MWYCRPNSKAIGHVSRKEGAPMTEQQPSQPSQPIQPSVERTWAMLCHLLAFAGFVFPFGNIIGPVIIWQIKKQESELVDDQGKESVNFQITVTIAGLVCFVLSFAVIGIPLAVALGIFDIVIVIIATIRANNGERYRYPVSWRVIK
jgi:hypothetical protein